MEECGAAAGPPTPKEKSRARPRGVRTEGVWVGRVGREVAGVDADAQEDEEDEMIWWAWDGRIAGFSDWV